MESNQPIPLWRAYSIGLILTIALILPLSGSAQSAKEPLKKKEFNAENQQKGSSVSTSNAVPTRPGPEADRILERKRISAQKAEAESNGQQARLKEQKERNIAEYNASQKAGIAVSSQSAPAGASETSAARAEELAKKRQAYEARVRSSGKSEESIQKKLADFDKLHQPRK